MYNIQHVQWKDSIIKEVFLTNVVSCGIKCNALDVVALLEVSHSQHLPACQVIAKQLVCAIMDYVSPCLVIPEFQFA